MTRRITRRITLNFPCQPLSSTSLSHPKKRRTFHNAMRVLLFPERVEMWPCFACKNSEQKKLPLSSWATSVHPLDDVQLWTCRRRRMCLLKTHSPLAPCPVRWHSEPIWAQCRFFPFCLRVWRALSFWGRVGLVGMSLTLPPHSHSHSTPLR